jgi:hypothetical protein
MRTGKLAISRGHQLPAQSDSAAPHLALVPRGDVEPGVEPPLAPPPASPEYGLVHDRLTSLERLTRLFEHGALSPEEFAAEKILILGLPVDDLVPRDAAPISFSPVQPRRPVRGPSLVGRMLSWKFILLSMLVGLGFSFVSQPDATMRLFDQIGRYFGA